MKLGRKYLLPASLGLISMVFLGGIYLNNQASKINGYMAPGSIELHQQHLYGKWVAPSSDNLSEIQGFILDADGTSRLVNTAVENYQLWHVIEDKLVLTPQTIQPKKRLVAQQVFIVDSLAGNRMYLKQGGTPVVYWKVR